MESKSLVFLVLRASFLVLREGAGNIGPRPRRGIFLTSSVLSEIVVSVSDSLGQRSFGKRRGLKDAYVGRFANHYLPEKELQTTSSLQSFHPTSVVLFHIFWSICCRRIVLSISVGFARYRLNRFRSSKLSGVFTVSTRYE